jgi:ArsR family transcriptional regulator
MKRMKLTTEQFAAISKALSDPIRLRILDLVQAGYDQLSASPPGLVAQGESVFVTFRMR